MLLLTVVLALTVTPGGVGSSRGWRACVPHDWSAFAHTGGGVPGTVLNVLLLLPFAACARLATGRLLRTALPVVGLPVAIELAQTEIPGRMCSPTDLIANISGACLGILLGCVADRFLTARRDQSLTEEHHS